jgi:ubiquitin-protein ligase
MTFPEARPTIIVCAKVLHRNLNPQTKIFNHHWLAEWSPASKLLPLLRQMQQEFETEPPMSEAKAAEMQQ